MLGYKTMLAIVNEEADSLLEEDLGVEISQELKKNGFNQIDGSYELEYLERGIRIIYDPIISSERFRIEMKENDPEAKKEARKLLRKILEDMLENI